MLELGSRQSRALLEERDYIGLAEASSTVKMKSTKFAGSSFVKDTDLRLSLGLGLAFGSICEGSVVVTQSAKEERSSSSQKTGMKRGACAIGREALWLPGPRVNPDICSQDSAAHDDPSSKDQIVGWPPVRLYRKKRLSNPAEMFVKVNMEGMNVGRKVDLSAYGSYKDLLLVLEDMFGPAVRGNDMNHILLSNESDYVLTYEDKEGDWMLVGDVPWSLFTSSVKRLRITHRLEANAAGMWAHLLV